jgi:oleate hydratase
MEAAYQLLGIDRGVPEVVNSTYDVRKLLAAASGLRDGKELELPVPALIKDQVMKRIAGTQISALLTEYGLIS